MNSIIFIATICLLIGTGVSAEIETRDAVVGFGLMINKVTGRNPLDYCGYGNYCGRGGSGTPVDVIDKCCKAHDECYARTKAKYNLCYPHIAIYTFSYDKAKNVVTCNGVGKCGEDTCACDRTAVMCFKANNASYNPKYKGTFLGQMKDCVSN